MKMPYDPRGMKKKNEKENKGAGVEMAVMPI